MKRGTKNKAAIPPLLDIVEAAYQVEKPDKQWLEGLAVVARPHLDEGFGLAAFEYYKPEGALPEIVQHFHLGIPEKLEAIYHTVFHTMDPEIRLRPFRLGPCISGSQLMGMRAADFKEQPHMKRFVQNFGMYDCDLDHRRRTDWIWDRLSRWTRQESGGPRRHRSSVGDGSAPTFRARSDSGDCSARSSRPKKPPEAILNPTGKVHDASGPASTSAARELLRRAVVSLEQSRGPLRSTNPDKSLAMRKALVGGRWSLIDQVDLDNRRYIVARENEPVAPGPESLTPREKQILGYAKLGHHNKLIAYELGIADSTVRVLLARAAGKIGVRTRDELVARYEDRWTPPFTGAAAAIPAAPAGKGPEPTVTSPRSPAR